MEGELFVGVAVQVSHLICYVCGLICYVDWLVSGSCTLDQANATDWNSHIIQYDHAHTGIIYVPAQTALSIMIVTK